MKEQLAIQRILRERYEGLRLKNPSYSVRAFSKKVGISPATLSLIFNGKRKISRKLAYSISQKLLLDPQERSELLSFFPVKAKHRIPGTDDIDASYLQLSADQYQVVGDWRVFALLGLIEMPGFKNDPEWISSRMGAPVSDVIKLLERLKRLEMIEENAAGELKRAKPRYRTTDDVANLSLKKSHYQNLELARESLDNHALDERDFTWVTFPMDKKKLAEAKTLIRKFQDDLYEVLEKDAEPNEVYRLAVQLFPLTRSQKQEK
jgi:uncharacterized protein (TIGR02147 family)